MSLTLITGKPGAGKTLLAVSQEAQAVPGSTVEASQSCVSHGVTYRKGDAVPRHLFSNIRGLLIEHTTIDAADLERWHEWAQPGDVVVFDEVQEVWRTRGLGAKVPEAIAALETHRHRGVDLVLVTQHPMLIDSNVRRLVNRHLDVRRMAAILSMIYEWDHCANPGQVRTALNSRMWWFPRKAFALYSSAQLHTKTKARIPPVAFIGLAAVAGLAIGGPMVYERLSGRFKPAPAAAASKPASVVAAGVAPGAVGGASAALGPASAALGAPAVPAGLPGAPGPLPVVKVAGCGVVRGACACFGTKGEPVEPVPGTCGRLLADGAAADVESLGAVEFGGRPGAESDFRILAAMRGRDWSR